MQPFRVWYTFNKAMQDMLERLSRRSPNKLAMVTATLRNVACLGSDDQGLLEGFRACTRCCAQALEHFRNGLTRTVWPHWLSLLQRGEERHTNFSAKALTNRQDHELLA